MSNDKPLRTRIAIDAMGGDFAPRAIIEGVVEAAKVFDHEIIMVGDPVVLRQELDRLNAANLLISIEPSSSVVEMHESPAQACRQKPDSSIMISAKLVAEHRADAMVSAGNSGATMAAALWHMRRLPGVSRPAITTIMPTLNGYCVVTDAGANVDCKPKHLLQFAIMGSQFVKHIFNRPSPKVGILSIGEEASKGNELTLAAAELLTQHVPQFIGNVEGRDIPKGMADVVVCDGFVGNVVLKFAEGLAEALMTLIKAGVKAHPLAKIGSFFMKSALGDVKRKLDYAEYGGAPLLGVNGVCIISHGKSNPKAIRNAIRMAGEFSQKQINAEICRELENLHTPSTPSATSPHASMMTRV